MKTESQQQIAREAVDKIKAWMEVDTDPWLPIEVKKCTEIILSAIERANEFATLEESQIEAAQPQRSETWIGGKCSYCGRDNGEHRDDCNAIFGNASQRSEQPFIPPPTGAQLAWQETVSEQDWTPEWLANYGKADNWLESICDAHNDTLTAERQRRELSARDIWKLEQERDRWMNRALSAQVAIERLSSERSWPVRQGRSAHDQLATSEWHKGWAAAIYAGESNRERLIAEVQKPLVEALEQLHSLIWNAGHIGHMRKIIDDALAKVEEDR